jgi:hypothetical protein
MDDCFDPSICFAARLEVRRLSLPCLEDVLGGESSENILGCSSLPGLELNDWVSVLTPRGIPACLAAADMPLGVHGLERGDEALLTTSSSIEARVF